MFRRLVPPASMVVALAVLAGCGSGVRKFPAPVTMAANMRLQKVWMQLQQEIDLDPSRPAWIEEMRWELEPDGKVRRMLFQVRATAMGETGPALYQVEGTGEWSWFKLTENPRPRTEFPQAQTLFAALDQGGFPNAYLAELKPARYYTLDLGLKSDPPDNGLQRALEQGRIREWTPGDEANYKGIRVPMLRAAEMVPMSPPPSGGQGYTSAGQAFYMIPGAAAR